MSSPDPFGEARLTVLLDVRHPLAALALLPTLDWVAASKLDPIRDVDWLPLSVPALKPPSPPGPPGSKNDRGVRHRRYRAQAIAREIESYGRAQGFLLHEPYRDGDAGAANRAWLWLRERQRHRLGDYLRALFRGYWSLELDPADEEQVAALVSETGADGQGFRDWSAADAERAAARVADGLRDRGLFQVPGYLVEDEVFYGRQHLPMIRWILEGREGPVPI